MAQSGTYGDHITLEAASNLSNIEIEIASSLGHHAHTMIQPQEYEPIIRFCSGHFAEGNGEHYVALDRYFVASSVSECDGGKETKSPFNNDDTDDMLNDDDAVDADDPFSYDDAIDAGSLFNNNGTVNNDDAVDGSDMFNNDDAVGTSDLFSNDDAVDLSIEVDEQPRELPYEIWKQTLSHVISQSDFLWPDHKCRLLCRIRSVNRQFYKIMKSLKLTLPRVYISDEQVLNQKSGKRAASVQRLIKRFGLYSGVILELKRIINSSKRNHAWVVLLPDAHSWFIVTNIFWRKR